MAVVKGTSGRADAAVAAMLDALGPLMRALPEGRWTQHPDLVAMTSGLPVARLNGVLVLGVHADRDRAHTWLEQLADRGLPSCILARPGAPAWIGSLAAAHDLTTLEDEPFMCLTDPGKVAEAADAGGVDGFSVDVLDPADPGQVTTGARLLADGFEAPRGVLDPLLSPAVLASPGVTAYIGRSYGQPCTTGLGVASQGHIGVFNIATTAPYRRRGFGRAVTARVVADGVAAGAHTAYLQASPMGFGLYQRMGFATVETWTCHYPQ